MDKIILSRMEFFGYHGVFPEENKLGQRFCVDAELSLPLAKAGESDDLEKTINYAEVYERIKHMTEERTFKLIEALAEHIAADLLEAFPVIAEVKVRVIKPHPPFAIVFDGVTVEIVRKRPVTAYIGLGSNIGDRESHLRDALSRLAARPGIRIARLSPVYETDPFGYTNQEAFLNMNAAIETTLSPEELHAAMMETEQEMGRVRDIRWGPRSIDLDLLLYGRQFIGTPSLCVPHPGIRERAFVLVPLAEIAPDHAVPGIVSLREHLVKLEGKDGVRLWKTTSDWLNESGPSGN